ncbi:MAG: single-stranded-DNA-specific exonuclease RecJ [Bacteroidia bacterium]|nr:single-stranded-DNA-specific exonuclease RecJ [Bacteroidia bacterium]MDW8346328.1 single-stranded-DNA-specific exonuclease RecJ [Bacteroidia bacterium]
MRCKYWNYQQLTQDEAKKAKELSQILNNLPYPLAEILIKRGIDTYQKAEHFFKPQLDHLHDPFLMKDMEAAVERILQAIEHKEKILIYGDYDVDGTTAVSLLYWFFRPFYEQYIGFYTPDRYTEGYGISFQGIDYAQENNFSLIISLDCGILAHEKVEYATKKGIDFIICDHHLPGETLPAAIAVLDPKRKDCPYPYKELSGCGVGFKLCQALASKLNIPKEKVYNLLDFVAVSIASDLVDVTGENRVMMYYGMKLLDENPKIGIKELMQVARIPQEQNLNTNDLVFKIGPRINAAGRLKHAKHVIELLTAQNNPPQGLADQINTMNENRRDLDKAITDEAISMIEKNKEIYEKRKSTVLFKEDWHKGVIGIVASKILERYYKPTILLTQSEGKVVGSARSVHDFDIHEAISACRDLLLQYGGHKYAAGLTLKKENIDAFILKFEEVVTSTIQSHSLTPILNIDAACKFEDLNEAKFMRILKRMGPFGPANMDPIFFCEKVSLYSGCEQNYRVVGNQHLQLVLTQDNKIFFNAIAFNMGTPEVIQKLKEHKYFNIIYHFQENVFNNKVTHQLKIIDIEWI